ncbi:TIGR01621 family pseudouridine synthase [Thiomicrorhabdus sp. ZW0627]|uniref:TIGR01621 family pseudouridine synthase n=1 Tax=Thiomicrorhabdus sp. ZW0627 TaxID=3039774 RepID=UPI0024365EFA|nr:TIGR01621 family pseudouridine synthase [Thiomicrorhabdus sp. ZW0627]MDG6773056.1 TIGR01621 family pseudouridine synthase [Thiomicrorhabdus sp. ZW0627]
MSTNSHIPVLFQNQDFVVIDKPEGLNVHSEDSAGLVVLLKQQLAVEELYPVHRLDKMTSGLMLFALNKSTAQTFQRLFEAHEVQKYYLAISDQKPKKKQGTIKGDMLPARRGSWKLAKSNDNPAITRFVSVSVQPGERLFLLKPVTGRTHQIRVALKSISAPICGDERYASAEVAKHEDRGYLHAYAVEFELFSEHYRFVCKPEHGRRFLSPQCRHKIEEWWAPWDVFSKA